MKGRVLVTGASGFVGRHLVRELVARGLDVHGAGRRVPPAKWPTEASWHGADLLEPGGAERLVASVRPTELVHLAWIATPGSYRTSAENVLWVDASLALLRAFASAGGRRAVIAGTCAEYAVSAEPCKEGVTPLAPACAYARAKLALAERAGGAAPGVAIAWARLFHLFGPHEAPSRLVPSVAVALLGGQPAKVTHGEQVRDYFHVADAAAALAALLGSEVNGAVNVASGRGVRVREVVVHLARALGRVDLVRLGAVETAAGEPPILTADTTRLREEVGWSSPAPLEERLDSTMKWWREELATAAPP